MTEAIQVAWWVFQTFFALAAGSHAIPPVCN